MSDAAETVPATAGEGSGTTKTAPAPVGASVSGQAADRTLPAITKAPSDSLTNDSAPRPPADSLESRAESDDLQSHAGLRRSDQLLIGVLSIAVILLMGVHWLRLSGWGMQPIEIEQLPSRQYEFRIDVNRATWVEWMQLEGIGETLAHRIIADRQQNGRFETVDELQRVKGLGPKTIEKLRPWLTVQPQADGPQSSRNDHR